MLALLLGCSCDCRCGGGRSGGGGGGGGIPPPSTSLLLEPAAGSLAAAPGATVTTLLEVTPATGVSGDVTLSLEGVPSCLSVGLSSSVLASGPSTLSIVVADGTAVGSYAFTARAVSSTENITILLSVHVVTAATISGVTLRVPPKVAMVKGQASSFEVGVERSLGVTGSIALQATVVPAGLSVTFGENPCPDAGSLVTISSLGSMAAGSYEVTLKGSTGGSSGTRTVLVEVLESSSVSDFWISRVEFGQTFFGEDLRLVSGKAALIRVHVIADRAGITSPTVRVKGVNGSTLVGTIDLSGPATVPTAEEPDSLTASYTGTIPASWVSSGIELRATLDPAEEVAERDESNNTLLSSTAVDFGKVLDIVVVPLTISSLTGRTLDFYETVFEHWPLRDITTT
ncbi:MAG: hypothetical protein GY946_26645, partial [bacterium]|nr:hypothetical protein [bacterium]